MTMKQKSLPVIVATGSFLLSGLLGFYTQGFAAVLNQVRLGSQSNQTQIILDLSGKADDVDLDDDNPHKLNITFSGKLSPSLQKHFLSIQGQQNLRSVYWNAHHGKVQIFLDCKGKSNIQYYALAHPDRLVVTIGKAYSNKYSEAVAPGVIHYHILQRSSQGPLNINVLDINLQNPQITVKPVLAFHRLHGKEKVSQMVDQDNAIAGINAAYFKPDKGTVLGTVILNKQLITGPLYHRVSLGITPDKKIKIAKVSLRGSFSTTDGRSIKINNVNQPRLNKEESILYSSLWGNLAPNVPRDGMEIQINSNNVVTAVSQDERLEIPEGGYVITAPVEGDALTLKPGDQLSLTLYTIPDWSDVAYAISGGPYLVKDNQIYVDLRQQSFRPGAFTKAAPRTAIGIKANGHLLMVTVDGRQHNVSIGMTLTELAHLMKKLGAVEAINLDGGSSTQMVIRGRLVNSPSVSGGARVSSSLIVQELPPPPIPDEIIGASSNATTHANNSDF